ncbi:hypothetical protein MJO52_11275 [Microbulbifer variabilis]|uniref:DUF2946 domain-containing protein n=1 Tax=Microbulbifer variabilis TaxID=266805 RepID=A0ABY4V9V3_9GAMM|nr:hypothetical protein [Microbulbifer variabilis]USD19665.1 hypothetical protein MJO52_11275 [Microbulbifer variabilis]
MNLVRLSFLLIALLVFQTAGAFYDSHEELQDVTGHLLPHHLDQSDLNSEFTSPELGEVVQVSLPVDEPAQQSPLLDFCNHCCHCHGSTVAGLLGQSFQPFLWGTISYREVINIAVPSGYFSPLLRPPITQV